MNFKSVVFVLLAMPVLVSAGFKGSVSFTNSEIANHKKNILELKDVAAQCLVDYRAEHLAFYNNNCRTINGRKVCLSKFYGDRRYAKTKGKTRADGTSLQFLGDALRKAGFSADYMNKMRSTSCVGMTLDCLKIAFRATNQESVWKKVLKFTRLNGVDGTALQEALRKLGWKVYYWNPSPAEDIVENMKRWDREEKNWQSKGWHSYRYQRLQSRGTYYFNKVDNKMALVGFGSSEPALLKSVAFWVGTAHTGYHVFPGRFGDVVEAHSTRKITAKDNLEFSRFSPFASGGGPRWTRTEKYRSGLIAIPPQ